MTDLSKEQAASREKTLLTALLLSAPGPLVTGLATLSSHSTTQLADFIRRDMELVALFLSWWVFRQLQRNTGLNAAEQSRLERAAGLSVAGTMLCSGLVMAIVALSRLSVYEPGGKVLSGLIIAILGLITNGAFWRRYTVLTREQYSSVIAAQQSLYRAKASVDLCVVTALTAVAVSPAHPATRYVDILGSIIVAGYLLWNGLRMAQTHVSDVKTWFQRLRRHFSASSPD
ncbi:MAG TPA: cation transporter [Anaerolineae bacterium]|nr:cation transporter [Anaerolineae bacterium]